MSIKSDMKVRKSATNRNKLPCFCIRCKTLPLSFYKNLTFDNEEIKYPRKHFPDKNLLYK